VRKKLTLWAMGKSAAAAAAAAGPVRVRGGLLLVALLLLLSRVGGAGAAVASSGGRAAAAAAAAAGGGCWQRLRSPPPSPSAWVLRKVLKHRGGELQAGGGGFDAGAGDGDGRDLQEEEKEKAMREPEAEQEQEKEKEEPEFPSSSPSQHAQVEQPPHRPEAQAASELPHHPAPSKDGQQHFWQHATKDMPHHTPEVFGSLEGHTPHTPSRHLPGFDVAGQRSAMLVTRRLALGVMGAVTILHGIGSFLFPMRGASRMVEGGILCDGADRVASMLGLAAVQAGSLELMLVWFGNDRAVKWALRTLGVGHTVALSLTLTRIARGVWEMQDCRLGVLGGLLAVLSCAYYGRQL
jgi:hypothetical protein